LRRRGRAPVRGSRRPRRHWRQAGGGRRRAEEEEEEEETPARMCAPRLREGWAKARAGGRARKTLGTPLGSSRLGPARKEASAHPSRVRSSCPCRRPSKKPMPRHEAPYATTPPMSHGTARLMGSARPSRKGSSTGSAYRRARRCSSLCTASEMRWKVRGQPQGRSECQGRWPRSAVRTPSEWGRRAPVLCASAPAARHQPPESRPPPERPPCEACR
ncbi:unnamed protein product, partial [Prorocentrum cordatum]